MQMNTLATYNKTKARVAIRIHITRFSVRRLPFEE